MSLLCCSFLRWEGGEGINEVGKDKATGIVRIRINKKYYRPTEVVNITLCCFGLEFVAIV